jgi:hypothetical protein
MTRPGGQSARNRLPSRATAGLVLIGLSSGRVRVGAKVAAALVGIVPIVSAFTYANATCMSDTVSDAGGRVLSHAESCSHPTSLVANIETWTTSPLSVALLLVPVVVAYILFIRLSRHRRPQL